MHSRATVLFPPLIIAKLRALIRYTPADGRFFWLQDRGAFKAGDELCHRRPDGYGSVTVRMEGRKWRILFSRLAWVLMTGENPKNEIDHADTDPSNDRWANLREATAGQNKCNRKIRKDNKTGLKGVSFHRQSGLWRMRYGSDGKTSYHSTAEAAAAAYRSTAAHKYGEFARA